MKSGPVRPIQESELVRSRQTTEDYAQLVSNLMFEVKSQTDSLSKLRQKIQDFLALGTQVGVLVDPRSRTMEVHRPGVEFD
jgi:Uma2 family endonuclease